MTPIRPYRDLPGPQNYSFPAQRLERFESSLVIARILEGNNTDLALSDSVTQGISLREALNRLPETRARQSVAAFGDQLESLLALSGEGNADRFFEALVDIGLRLESQDRFEAAVRIFSTVVDLNSNLELSPERRNSVARAQDHLDLIMGRGTWSGRFEFYGRRLLRDAADPTLLVGMGAASLVYRSVRYFFLARYVRPIVRADLVPLALATPAVRAATIFDPPEAVRMFMIMGAGISAAPMEAIAYCFATRLTEELRGRPQDWNSPEFATELRATAILFLSMRYFSGVSTLLARRTMGIRHPALPRPRTRNPFEEIEWVVGEAELAETIRRVNPSQHADGARRGWAIIRTGYRLSTPSRLQRLTHEAALQSGMLFGLVFGHRALEETGLRSRNSPPEDILGNSLRILAQVNLMRIIPVFRRRTASLESALERPGGLFYRSGVPRLPH